MMIRKQTKIKINQREIKKDIRLLKKGQEKLNDRIDAVLMDIDLMYEKTQEVKKAM